MKRRADHVVWDNSVEGTRGQPYPAYRFRCRHCGDVYDMPVPCSIRVMGAVMRAYYLDHKGCRPTRLNEERNELLGLLAARYFQLLGYESDDRPER